MKLDQFLEMCGPEHDKKKKKKKKMDEGLGEMFIKDIKQWLRQVGDRDNVAIYHDGKMYKLSDIRIGDVGNSGFGLVLKTGKKY